MLHKLVSYCHQAKRGKANDYLECTSACTESPGACCWRGEVLGRGLHMRLLEGAVVCVNVPWRSFRKQAAQNPLISVHERGWGHGGGGGGGGAHMRTLDRHFK